MCFSILIAGDYSPNDRVANQIQNENYESVFGDIVPIVEDADYSIVNFESTVCVDDGASPIEKCGPNLSCTPHAVMALKYIGFNCVSLANNHFADYGDEGVAQTLECLRQNSIDYVGGGMNIEDSIKVLYKSIKGYKLAVLNFCEEEFTIATKEHGGSAPLDWTYVVPQIVEAKHNADFVFVIIHGGKEFYNLPTPRMKRAYRALIDMGVDVVVNHHQHCYSGFEVYKDKPILYGLGNFCFDFRGKANDPWNEGYLARFTIGKRIEFEVIPFYQCNGEPTIKLMNETQRASFFAKIEGINSILLDDDQLEIE